MGEPTERRGDACARKAKSDQNEFFWDPPQKVDDQLLRTNNDTFACQFFGEVDLVPR